jgi:hypothetical protein
MRDIAAVSTLAPLIAAEPGAPEYYELRYYQLRNGYSKKLLPTKLASAGRIGVFTPVIAESSPFVLMLLTYSSMAEAERAPEFELDYVRYERTLLKAFTGMPRMKLPPEAKSGHIFELRTYESDNAATLRKKIDMFNRGEMGIFQRLGMNPVFFGEAIVGSKLPHLTYMLAYDDLAARDRLWKDFGSDPAWLKLRAEPGLADADIVSNISNMIVRPASISDIR